MANGNFATSTIVMSSEFSDSEQDHCDRQQLKGLCSTQRLVPVIFQYYQMRRVLHFDDKNMLSVDIV